MVTNAESEKRWWRFLNNLYRRGLTGEALGLIVTDGNPGLENAVDIIYPFVKRQGRYTVPTIKRKLNRLTANGGKSGCI